VWDGSWAGTEFEPPNTRAAVDRWCKALGQADNPTTKASQLRPENQWEIHPVIDGCSGSEGNNPR
jgi:hypothetical protein